QCLGPVAVAQVHRPVLAPHHLGDAARVAQIEERHAAVVTATADPAGEGDGLSDVLRAELTGGVGAQHEVSFWWCRQVGPLRATGRPEGHHARWRGQPTLPRRVSDLDTAALLLAPWRP